MEYAIISKDDESGNIVILATGEKEELIGKLDVCNKALGKEVKVVALNTTDTNLLISNQLIINETFISEFN